MRFDQLRRRDFITLLGSVAAAWPLAARAQQTAIPVIGFISGRSPSDSEALATAFLRGLTETGFIEGRNVTIEYRWAEYHNERLPAMVADLVRRKVAVIAAIGGTLRCWRQKRRPRQYQLSLRWAATPLHLAWSPISISRVVTSRA
jgi:putative ABC transport system substrate-binding protein